MKMCPFKASSIDPAKFFIGKCACEEGSCAWWVKDKCAIVYLKDLSELNYLFNLAGTADDHIIIED